MRTIEGEQREISWRGPRLEADGARVQGCSVLRVRGDMDFTSAPGLRDWLLEAVDDGLCTTRIVLDLGEVAFFDSSGLGAIVAVWKKVRAEGGDLGVARPPGVCSIMMRRTSLADHILMAASVPAATAGLLAGGPRPAKSRAQAQAG